jgi:dinuclear metal center YbgI/SA1388 family protein
MRLSEIISILESAAPLAYQEDYDNSGLAIGDPGINITGILLCLDVTLPVVDEAIRTGANLIISHHPVIFKPVKKITGSSDTEKIIIKAIRSNLAIYCAHTNVDNICTGVSRKICEKLGIENTKVLMPLRGNLKKLVTYVPGAHAEAVRDALFAAGAGHIGKYDACSYNAEGKGSFRALEGATPFVGAIGQLHFEDEVRIETVFPAIYKKQVIGALLANHPYEEVAYDIYALENDYEFTGSGMIGMLKNPENEVDFLHRIRATFSCMMVRHSLLLNKSIQKVAVCGGSGSFLISEALSAGADLFLTADVKYHQFAEAEGRLVIVDIGHYESEQFTIEIFYDILIKKLPNFAIHFSSINTSPVYYL